MLYYCACRVALSNSCFIWLVITGVLVLCVVVFVSPQQNIIYRFSDYFVGHLGLFFFGDYDSAVHNWENDSCNKTVASYRAKGFQNRGTSIKRYIFLWLLWRQHCISSKQLTGRSKVVFNVKSLNDALNKISTSGLIDPHIDSQLLRRNGRRTRGEAPCPSAARHRMMNFIQ